jgi:hypothetical protein
MFVVATKRSARDPRPWLWVAGTLVLPLLLLAGFGPGMDHVLRTNPETVKVVIHANRLEMPGSLTAGDIVFEVTNGDSVSHGLALRKEGTDTQSQLDAGRPGATGRESTPQRPNQARTGWTGG